MKFKQKGAESAFLLNMTIRTQECRFSSPNMAMGLPTPKVSGILFSRIIAFVGMCAAGRAELLPGFYFDPFPICVSCRIRCRMKLSALPLSGRMVRLSSIARRRYLRKMAPLPFPYSPYGRSVFGTIDGTVRVRYIRQEPFFLCFLARISRGEAVTCCPKTLFSLIFSPEIWSFTNFDLLLRSVVSEESRSPERWVSG